jgi:hypothetical protein
VHTPIEMASRIVWIKVGGAEPAPFEGSLDVFPALLIVRLLKTACSARAFAALP